MSEAQKTAQLAADMRALYGRIYQNDSWEQWLGSRKLPHMDYRHIVRYLVRQDGGASYQAVADAERELAGAGTRHHTTIMNSIWQVNADLRERYRGLIANLDVFYDDIRSERVNLNQKKEEI